jgi:hypothetical protein
MSFYSDKKYDVIERTWFGLSKANGGDAAAGFTFNETQAALIKRYYPKGPIKLLKIGVMTLATLGKGEQLVGLTVGGTATVKATIVASSASAPYTIASKTLATTLSAGSYLSLLASTNVCSTGSVAVFIDFRRQFDVSGKWDPSS